MTPKDKSVAQQAAELNKHLGLKFIHVRDKMDGKVCTKGGCTLAYKVRDKEHGGSIVDVSVALCNPNDVYSRALGRLIAVSNFVAGKHVNLRVPKRCSVALFLADVFDSMNY